MGSGVALDGVGGGGLVMLMAVRRGGGVRGSRALPGLVYPGRGAGASRRRRESQAGEGTGRDAPFVVEDGRNWPGHAPPLGQASRLTGLARAVGVTSLPGQARRLTHEKRRLSYDPGSTRSHVAVCPA